MFYTLSKLLTYHWVSKSKI